MSKRNQQRLSQLITTFGPGSMLDLPTRSVMIGGLNRWQMRNNAWKPIAEPRLVALLQRFLGEEGRIATDIVLSLRTPPLGVEKRPGVEPDGIEVVVFPQWFVCEPLEVVHIDGRERRARRMVHWKDLEATGGKRKYRGPDKQVDVTPLRFIAACENGHIQDIPWRWVVHREKTCKQQMWLEERGTSADPGDTFVICECGAHTSLQQAFVKESLGRCGGERPWLGPDAREPCVHSLRLLIRTATNTYFPQVVTVISLPVGEDEFGRLVAKHAGDLKEVKDLATLDVLLKHVITLKEAFRGYTALDVMARLDALRERDEQAAAAPPQLAEFDMLASGKRCIGVNKSASVLYAETLQRSDWEVDADLDLGFIKNIVEVHRLREVMCQYGFTRFEAAPTLIEDEFEDIRLAVGGAPLAEPVEWLPAIEQFGEGFFVHVDGAAMARWLQRPGVTVRAGELRQGFERWSKSKGAGPGERFPGVEYVLLHSLAHALMIEVSLECGYPASSIKERVYSIRPAREQVETGRFGILLYTASSGAQGTLGGLVGAARCLPRILAAALARIEVCSNDPICADHKPADRNDDRALHGAACHGCLLVSETSCERRNVFLDRALLADTIASNEASLFSFAD